MIAHMEQPYRRMTWGMSSEEATVRRKERTVFSNRECQINAIPKRHLIVERQIECAFK